MSAVLLSLLSMQVHAANAWYYGTVKRVYVWGNGFIITMNSTALDDCQHKYVYFSDSLLSVKKVDRAYSMALAAQASGRTLGVVIDKTVNGPGGTCNSNGSIDITD